MGANDAFDMRQVAAYFRACERQLESGEKDCGMDDYIRAFTELNKLFYRLGRVFSFIGDDIKEKTEILAQHRQSPVGGRYTTVENMLAYERYDARLLDTERQPEPKELPNGSRTLLRLHRALAFVANLIDRVRLSKDGDKMSDLTEKAYQETLAQYHTWGIRKMVQTAVMTLPNRGKIVKMLTGPVPPAEIDNVMKAVVDATNAVYNIVQSHYEHHQLLELP